MSEILEAEAFSRELDNLLAGKPSDAAGELAADLEFAAALRRSDLSAQSRVKEELRANLSVPRPARSFWLRAAPPAGWTTERPAPDVLVLRRDGERLVVRPSGTEPKLKAYLEVVEPPDDDVPAARARAAARLAALRDEVAGLWPDS